MMEFKHIPSPSAKNQTTNENWHSDTLFDLDWKYNYFIAGQRCHVLFFYIRFFLCLLFFLLQWNNTTYNKNTQSAYIYVVVLLLLKNYIRDDVIYTCLNAHVILPRTCEWNVDAGSTFTLGAIRLYYIIGTIFHTT